MFGRGYRALINLPLRFNDEEYPITINAIFKVDTGTTTTILTKKVL